MTETPLDHAHAQMQADPDAQMPRLRFYDRLLGAELFVLLERPMAAGQDRIEPKILTSEGVSFVLAFDREERLSQFVDWVEAPYAALTGRALAKMLAPQDIGLGLNLGVAPSEILLDGAAMIWLRDIAKQGPTSIDARPVALNAPRGLPQDVLIALDAKLAGLTGLAAGAYLALADYADGSHSHILCFIDAVPEAHAALARVVSEMLHLSGVEAGMLDVGFLPAHEAFVAKLAKVGLRFDLPQVEKPRERPAPGSDPDNPPKLR